jgi:hypothetical protein
MGDKSPMVPVDYPGSNRLGQEHKEEIGKLRRT